MVDVIESVVFCPHCQNILSPGKQGNDLVYSCRLCNYVEKSKVKNYRINYASTETGKIYDTGVCQASDFTVPRVKKKCPGCKSDYAIYLVEPRTLKKTFYCATCDT